jgi:hypothetical protein
MFNRKLQESTKKIIAHSQEWLCGMCKCLLPPSYQIDHIVPFSLSQNDNIENLMALCPNCHSQKTQKEHYRILMFRKLSNKSNCDLCWFCLSPNTFFHNCDKKLKKIELQQEKPKKIKCFDEFIYVNDKFDNLSLQKTDQHQNTTLTIELTREYIFVDKFFTDSKNLTLNDIARAVFTATRKKQFSKFFTDVEVTIDIEPDTPDQLVDFIITNLPGKLPSRIFSKPIDLVDFTIVCL